MKKLSILLLLVTNILSAQNSFNEKGNRQGKWSGVYEDTKNLRYEGEFNDGKEIGVFYLYDNTKKKVVISTRDYTRKDGLMLETIFDQSGNKVSEGTVKNKKRHGKWTYYFKGVKTIMSEENYVDGKLNGEVKTYFKNGTLLETKNYKNDVLEGKYQRFSEKGLLLHNLNYKNGKLHGPGEYFTSSGKIYTKGQYADNMKIGKWPVFDKNGKEVEVSRTQKTNPKRTSNKSQNKTK